MFNIVEPELAHRCLLSLARSKRPLVISTFEAAILSLHASHTPNPLNVSHPYNEYHPTTGINSNGHCQVGVRMLCTGGMGTTDERNKRFSQSVELREEGERLALQGIAYMR